MLYEKYGILGKQNKINSYEYYFKMLLSKLDSLFEWKNLPSYIDTAFLNSNLFLFGYCAFFTTGGDVHINFGSFGGKPNEMYMPTKFIISNPVLGNLEYNINTFESSDCVIMYNTESDKQFINYFGEGGLYRLIKQTATLLADNVQSINMAQINSRVQAVFRASDENQKNSAEQIIKRMYNGEPYQVLVSDELNQFDLLNIDTSTDKTIQTLLQVHQYILADFYNQIGISTTPYQKKERMITDEIDTLDKTNDCNIYTMLNARKTALETINSLFGTNITVDLADWLKRNTTSEEPVNTSDTDNTNTDNYIENKGGEDEQ